MLKMTLGLAFVLISFGICAQTYQGTLGKHPIMLETHEYGASSYIYQRHFKRIFLRGSVRDVQVKLATQSYDKDAKTEQFILKKQANRLDGYWHYGQTTLPVKLIETDQQIGDYQKAHRQWQTIGQQHFGSLTLNQVREQHTGFTFFRLGKGFSKAQRDFLNPILTKAQEGYVAAYEECEEPNFWPEISLVNEHYLSYSVGYDIYCGGAHPSHGQEMFVYDLKARKQVKKISELYPNVDYLALLKAKYGADLEGQPECVYFENGDDHWKYAQWRLTAKGIVIIPSFAHALAPCEVPVKLSFDELSGKTAIKPTKVF